MSLSKQIKHFARTEFTNNHQARKRTSLYNEMLRNYMKPKKFYEESDSFALLLRDYVDERQLTLETTIKPLNHIFYFSLMPGINAGSKYLCNQGYPHGMDYYWTDNINCKCAKTARQAHYLSFMWAFYCREVKHTKRLYKYYLKLEKLVLSQKRYIKYFSPDWIFKPSIIMGEGFNIVKELSDHLKAIGYEEENRIVTAQEQCGTNQSTSADCWDELVKLYTPLEAKYTPLELHNTLKPVEQGLFSVDHNWKIEDEQIGKLQKAMTEVQESFFEGLKGCVMVTAKQLAVMFATISTVALLTKMAAGIALNTILKLLNFIYQFTFGGSHSLEIEETIAVQQSGEASIPFLPSMILKYVINPPEHIIKTLWTSSETDRVMRRLGYIGDLKVEKGIERVIAWIHLLIRRVERWYRIYYLKLEDVPDLEDNSHAIVEWNESVEKILKDYYSGAFVWNDSQWSALWNLYSTGLKFTRSNQYAKYRNNVWSIVTKLGNLLEAFKQHRRSGTSIRNPPVTIYLSGGTGVGKSSVTYPMAVEILKGIFEEENTSFDLAKQWQSLIYMRSPEQEYWDGYENQFVTVFDDYSQMADSQANPNIELFEIIRASNCFPYPLHMAELSQKSNTQFTSKIIIVSSNLEKPEANSLNFPSALHRRFDICVRVGRKDSKEILGNRFRPDIYTFELYEMASGKSLGQVTYQDLVKLSIEKYKSRCSYVDSIHEYIQDLFVQQPLVEVEQPRVPDEFDVGSLADQRISEHQVKEFAVEQGPVSLTDPLLAIYPVTELTFRPHNYGSLSYAWHKVKSYFSPENIWAALLKSVVAMKSYYDEMQKWWDDFRRDHPYIWKATMAITLISVGLTFLKIFNSFKNCIKEKAVAESYSPTTIKLAKQEAYSPSVAKLAKQEAYTLTQAKLARAEASLKVEEQVAEMQGVKDLNASEILTSVMRYNVYKMYVSETNICIGHILFIKGKLAIMPRHYLNHLNLLVNNNIHAHVYCESPILRRAFECKVSDILQNVRTYESPEEDNGPVSSRDLMVVEIPTAVVSRNIQDLFVRRGESLFIEQSSVMLPVIVTNNIRNSDAPVIMVRYGEGHSQVKRRERLNVANNDNVIVRYIRDAWEYNMDTVSSECGAPLIVRNTQVKHGKICGIHIAGIPGTGKGFSTPLYYEDIEMILDMFPQQFEQKVRLPMGPFPVEQCQVPEQGEFIRLGSLSNPLAQPRKSKIVPSLAHASYKQPETKPCLLHKGEVDGEEFDPRSYRIGRLGNVPVALDREMIENARKAFEDEISQEISKVVDIVPDSVKKVYTFDEAVLGIDGDPYVNCIKRTTSPGFPFVQQPGYKTRKEIFGNSDVCDLSRSQVKYLRQRVDEIISSAKRGVVLDHYFIDTLKDERKPIHKAHKTRLFSAGPLDYLIASKMYFNGPVALLQRARNDCHVSVGTNPYSEDWDRIVRKLQSKSENMIAGDFEGFDASQHQSLLEAAGEVLITLSRRFLGATVEDVRVMRVLLISLINSMHITGKEIYQWTHSLPSGHYLTAIINSIFVNISFACIWQLSENNVSYMRARSFWQKCGIVAYGDDHIVSIPGKELETFNQMALPTLFAKIGLSYTMEEKETVATMKSRRIDEISYLKRGFLFDKMLNRWIAPLSLSTILEMPQWIHQCPDPKAQTIANLEFALKELSCHEARVWSEWSGKLHAECVKLGHYSEFVNQMETRAICLDQDLVL